MYTLSIQKQVVGGQWSMETTQSDGSICKGSTSEASSLHQMV